jgi:hypothetical protein
MERMKDNSKPLHYILSPNPKVDENQRRDVEYQRRDCTFKST